MITNNFDSFLQSLNIPKPCELNKSIFKKMFLDNGVLDATDRASLKNDIDKIRWLYTLKPSTINIASYNDQEREYLEIAVLHIELSSPKHLKRIAHFINRSIPYPLMLLFTCGIEGQSSLAIGLADKRINQADKDKWVIEDSIHTDWINLSNQSEAEVEFLASFKVSNLPFKNFFIFYQALMQRVIAINCANHSHVFALEEVGQKKSDNRLEKLRELEKLDSQKSEIVNKLSKEKQMGRQVDMNTQVKKINDKIAQIKDSL
ncbi:MAG: DUF4391 domain-containing protein [Candidatus Thiodiazotropha sp. (ex Troendleina suluensis)]|nr:DUF4391 domain-containing protein [Candidatus Thiodiazotropha sp. (ex Troendleina suluensis)]